MSAQEQRRRPEIEKETPMRAKPKVLSLLIATAIALFAVPAASAKAAAVWDVAGHHSPSVFQAGGQAEYSFTINNVGDSAAPGPVTVEVELPDGVTTRVVRADENLEPVTTYATAWWRWNGASGCPGAPGASTATCTIDGPVPPGSGYPSRLTVFVDIAPDAAGPLTAQATITDQSGTTVSEETAPLGHEADRFGLVPDSFRADAFDVEGASERQAGRHPFRATASFDLLQGTTIEDSSDGPMSWPLPVGTLRNIGVDLPPGLVGNPLVMAQCIPAELSETRDLAAACPANSQVGTIDFAIVTVNGLGAPRGSAYAPLYNMVPPPGTLAAFAFQVVGRPVFILATLDPRDYSVVTTVADINETFPVFHQKVTLWGNPADPAHDSDRWNPETGNWEADFTLPERPLISLPTECDTPDVSDVFRLNSWQQPWLNAVGPGGVSSAPVELNGCDQLEFEPTVEIKSTTNLADSPSGLEFDLRIPQKEDPEGLATAHLRDAVVKLPQGMTVNPPSADGLGSCSMAQVGIGAGGTPTTVPRPNGELDASPVSCPDASKLGTAEAISPAIDHPIKGAVYLAEQGANPFGSLIAMYLVLEDPETGLLVKLAGKAEPDPATGQITATFRNNPQLPVEEIRLKLKEGPRAPLKTPTTCGVHTTEATFTPWSAPEAPSVARSSSFELTQGPGGGACPPSGGSAPNSPSFNAGTMDPTAKAFSPFVLKLARADGSQQLARIETTLPKGLVAKLAGTTYCSDSALSAAAGRSGKAERGSASCPATSRVGSVNVGAGAGSTPLYVSGEAYLAGPYKGAPLSLAIITPAVAGPFDLGTVVVRTALQVNPESAQVKAVSDELPKILQGIPLNIRSIALKMDRPEFVLNPTSCDPMSVDGSALSVFNQNATLTNSFQVGECNKLAFKPKLAMSFAGSTRRSGHPALKATLTARPGDANIARAEVTLPKTEFLEQSHIRTICTRVQYAAKSCPKGAVYGYAKAWTPLLDQPLEGPVYLRSSSNKLPDLVADLNGQLEVDLVGRIDSPKARIRNTFELVPDAPVSKFVLTMQGGKKGLLVNNTNLCKAKPRLSATFEAQNGKVAELNPLVKTDCGKKGRGGKGKKRGAGKR